MSIDFGTDIYEEPLFPRASCRRNSGELSLRPHPAGIHRPAEGQGESVRFHRGGPPPDGASGPYAAPAPGPGQNHLAGIIAAEMGVNIRITSGPAIEKPGDLAALLTNLSENDILFVDEIHRLNRSVEEILYPAMEDLRHRHHHRQGPVRQLHPAGPAEIYPHRGHHPGRAAVRSTCRDPFGVTLRLELSHPEAGLIVTPAPGS